MIALAYNRGHIRNRFISCKFEPKIKAFRLCVCLRANRKEARIGYLRSDAQVAVSAQALHDQNFFCRRKTLRQRNRWNVGMLQAGSHVALLAIKMHVVVVVVGMAASGTNGVFGLKLLVWNPVYNSGLQKLFEASVNGCPVYFACKQTFQVVVRERMRTS